MTWSGFYLICFLVGLGLLRLRTARQGANPDASADEHEGETRTGQFVGGLSDGQSPQRMRLLGFRSMDKRCPI